MWVWTQPRTAGGRLSDDVQAALALGGRLHSTVWVLCEDFWAQSLTLPRAQTAGLSSQEVAQALQFEVEPFSGLTPGESALGYRATPRDDGADQFWVVACAREELAMIGGLVRRAGGRLQGVSHPAGLPVPLTESVPSGPWRRIERWSRGSLLVRSATGGMGDTIVDSSVSETEMPPAAPSERVEALDDEGTAAPAAPPDAQRFTLNNETHLRRWLTAWAHNLRETPAALALAKPPSAAPRLGRYVLLGIAAEAVAVVVCAAHWGWVTVQRDRLRRELGAIEAASVRLDEVERQNVAARSEMTELRRTIAGREVARLALARRRHAMPSLLRALSEAKPDDVVIRELRDGGPWRVRIGGVSLSAGAADDLAVRLASALKDGGWTVQPLQKRAEGLLPDAGPWRFALQVALQDAAPVAAAGPRLVGREDP
jgi:hypothetical protein